MFQLSLLLLCGVVFAVECMPLVTIGSQRQLYDAHVLSMYLNQVDAEQTFEQNLELIEICVPNSLAMIQDDALHLPNDFQLNMKNEILYRLIHTWWKRAHSFGNFVCEAEISFTYIYYFAKLLNTNELKLQMENLNIKTTPNDEKGSMKHNFHEFLHKKSILNNQKLQNIRKLHEKECGDGIGQYIRFQFGENQIKCTLVLT